MEHTHTHAHDHGNYRKLAIMVVLSFISMFTLMYAMVNTLDNVFINVNQFYMAGLMTASMIVIEIVLMGAMYMNKKLNAGIIGLSIVIVTGCYVAIRQQAAVNDRQFLRSMIPHHAGAILMCQSADIKDPEVKKLCEAIRASQQVEIEQMKARLNALEAK